MPGIFRCCLHVDDLQDMKPRQKKRRVRHVDRQDTTLPFVLKNQLRRFSKKIWVLCALCVVGVSGVIFTSIAVEQPLLHLEVTSGDFVGRDADLLAIKKLLATQDVKEGLACAAISGEAGIGKTAISSTFAQRYVSHFSLIYWIDGSNPDAFEQSYRELAQTLNIAVGATESSVKKVNDYLNQYAHAKPWLLIIDDVRRLPQHLPQRGGSIIFTCRDRGVFPSYMTYDLQKNEEEAIQLMERITAETRSEDMEQLVRALDALPLLVHNVGHYIAATPGFDVSNYLQVFAAVKRSSKSPYFTKDLREHYPRNLAATYQITLDLLAKKDPLALEFLQHAVYLHSKKIPAAFLESWLMAKYGTLPEGPLLKGNIIRELSNHGLITYNETNETLSMSTPLQDIVLQQQHSCDWVESVAEALYAMDVVKHYNPTVEETIQPFQKILPHCLAVLSHDHTRNGYAVQLALTVGRYYLDTRHQLTAAREYLELAKQWSQGDEHPITGRIAFLIGVSYYLEGCTEHKLECYNQALGYFQSACDSFTRCLDPLQYETLEQNPAKCMRDYQLAITLQYQGQTLKELAHLDKAETVLAEALEAFLRFTQGREHFDIARILREQGDILARRGNIESAIEKVQEAVAMQRRVYAERFLSQPTVGATYRLLGDLFLKSKKYQQADEAYQCAIQVNLAAYKTEYHPYTAHLYQQRAEALRLLGRPRIAQELSKRREIILKDLAVR